MVLSLGPHRALGAQFHLERGCAVIHQIIVVVTETGWRAALGCVGRIGIGGGHLLLPSQVSAIDPPSLLLPAAALLFCAGAASLSPALRATSIQPIDALRAE